MLDSTQVKVLVKRRVPGAVAESSIIVAPLQVLRTIGATPAQLKAFKEAVRLIFGQSNTAGVHSGPVELEEAPWGSAQVASAFALRDTHGCMLGSGNELVVPSRPVLTLPPMHLCSDVPILIADSDIELNGCRTTQHWQELCLLCRILSLFLMG
ncbi:hypothetical protein NDU88_008856 [Pleurodeles waltl]|uniref:Uncharacterized protein n=1 Tax=Pleurodeles waltl TaxID=8319 RepID=A0AAV7PU99_PLEWA|nr:hypothetical protein NDU88_008856 [Pleurodeles waltl]